MKNVRALAALVFLAALGLTSSSRADVCACIDLDDQGAEDDQVCCPAFGPDYLPSDPNPDVVVCGAAEAAPDTFAAGCVGERPPSQGALPAYGCISVAGVESVAPCRQSAAVGCLVCGCAKTEIDATACGGNAD